MDCMTSSPGVVTTSPCRVLRLLVTRSPCDDISGIHGEDGNVLIVIGLIF